MATAPSHPMRSAPPPAARASTSPSASPRVPPSAGAPTPRHVPVPKSTPPKGAVGPSSPGHARGHVRFPNRCLNNVCPCSHARPPGPLCNGVRSRLAASARTVKPVRAVLDLTDADEWIVEFARATWRKLMRLV
eukprot:4402675-Prymnesium_polylepis.1